MPGRIRGGAIRSLGYSAEEHGAEPEAQPYVYAGWQRRLAWERGIGLSVQDRAEQDRIGGAR